MGGYLQKTRPAAKPQTSADAQGIDARSATPDGSAGQSPARSLLQLRQALDGSPRVQQHTTLQRALDQRAAAPAKKKSKEKPALQRKGIAINDDPGLEREADVMGARARALPQTAANAGWAGTIQRVNGKGSTSATAAPASSTTTAPKNTATSSQTLAASNTADKKDAKETQQIKAEIASEQQIVEHSRETINLYSTGFVISANLRRGQLNDLIAALESSIPAREQVNKLNAQLGITDAGHPQRIQVEKNMRTAALADFKTIKKIAKSVTPHKTDPTLETVVDEHWDREDAKPYHRPKTDAGGEWSTVQDKKRK